MELANPISIWPKGLMQPGSSLRTPVGGRTERKPLVLGLTAEAQKAVTSEFTAFGGQRFVWFWRAGHDWIPDLDNGGSGMITLQQMLMQCAGKRIQLLPAWPKEWTAASNSMLHTRRRCKAASKAVRLRILKVTPASRTKDVAVVRITPTR